jgi:PAS domain S-box-containing protein
VSVERQGERRRLDPALVEHASDGICIIDRSGAMLETNARLGEMLGYEPGELRGANIRDFITPEDLAAQPLMISRVLHGERLLIERRLCRKDGSFLTAEISTKRVDTERLHAVVRDVSRRVEAERALRDSEARFRQILGHLPHVFFLGDPASGHLIYLSPPFERVFGVPADAYRLRPEALMERIHPADRDRVRQVVARHTEGASTEADFRIVRPDGAVRWIRAHAFPVRSAHGQVARVAGIAEDVTEQREAARALQESERRLRAVIRGAPVVLFALDAAGIFTLCEGKGLETIGRTPDELVGRSVYDLYGDGTDIVRGVRRALEGVEVQYVTTTEDVTWEIRISPVLAADGSVQSLIGVATDTTEQTRAAKERQQIELRMRQAQKLESLGVLAGGIAHDFNNLLTGVLANAGLARARLPADDPAHDIVEQVEHAAQRAADLTNQLLAYSGQGRFQITRIRLHLLVEEMAALLTTVISKDTSLAFDFDGAASDVEGDAAQLQQLVMNLITNASEACDKAGGHIVLRVTDEHVRDPEGATGWIGEPPPSGRYVVLEVRDTGEGMDARTQQRIFDPFFTTKGTRRGLGLAAVLGIIRGHKGAVQLLSELGGGTTFRVLIPSAGPPREEVQLSPASPSEWRGGGTILVVDDEEIVRDVTRLALEDAGFTVVGAAEGEEAIRVVKEDGGDLALVILDLTMPGLSGEEVFFEIHRLRPGLPVVLCSGYSEQEAAAHLAGEGLAGFLQKPFRATELLAKVQQVLEPRA